MSLESVIYPKKYLMSFTFHYIFPNNFLSFLKKNILKDDIDMIYNQWTYILEIQKKNYFSVMMKLNLPRVVWSGNKQGISRICNDKSEKLIGCCGPSCQNNSVRVKLDFSSSDLLHEACHCLHPKKMDHFMIKYLF